MASFSCVHAPAFSFKVNVHRRTGGSSSNLATWDRNSLWSPAWALKHASCTGPVPQGAML
eukprot:scaffold212696_cov22-Tisochrysis_lutea.AAC.1